MDGRNSHYALQPLSRSCSLFEGLRFGPVLIAAKQHHKSPSPLRFYALLIPNGWRQSGKIPARERETLVNCLPLLACLSKGENRQHQACGMIPPLGFCNTQSAGRRPEESMLLTIDPSDLCPGSGPFLEQIAF